MKCANTKLVGTDHMRSEMKANFQCHSPELIYKTQLFDLFTFLELSVHVPPWCRHSLPCLQNSTVNKFPVQVSWEDIARISSNQVARDTCIDTSTLVDPHCPRYMHDTICVGYSPGMSVLYDIVYYSYCVEIWEPVSADYVFAIPE